MSEEKKSTMQNAIKVLANLINEGITESNEAIIMKLMEALYLRYDFFSPSIQEKLDKMLEHISQNVSTENVVIIQKLKSNRLDQQVINKRKTTQELKNNVERGITVLSDWSKKPDLTRLDKMITLNEYLITYKPLIEKYPSWKKDYEAAEYILSKRVRDRENESSLDVFEGIKNLTIYKACKKLKSNVIVRRAISVVAALALVGSLAASANSKSTQSDKTTTDSSKVKKTNSLDLKAAIRKTYKEFIKLQSELVKMEDKCGIGLYQDGKTIGELPLDMSTQLSFYMNLGDGQITKDMKVAMASGKMPLDQIKSNMKNLMSQLRNDLFTMKNDTKQEFYKIFKNKQDQKIASKFIEAYLDCNNTKNTPEEESKKVAFLNLSKEFFTNPDSKDSMNLIKSPVAMAYILGVMNTSMDAEFGLGIDKAEYEQLTSGGECDYIRSYLFQPNELSESNELACMIDAEIDMVKNDADSYTKKMITDQLLDKKGNLKQGLITISLDEKANIMDELVEAVGENVNPRNFVLNPVLELEKENITEQSYDHEPQLESVLVDNQRSSFTAENSISASAGAIDSFQFVPSEDVIISETTKTEPVPLTEEEKRANEEAIANGDVTAEDLGDYIRFEGNSIVFGDKALQELSSDEIIQLEKYIKDNQEALASGKIDQREFDVFVKSIYEKHNSSGNTNTENPPSSGITDPDFAGNKPDTTDKTKLPTVTIDGTQYYEHSNENGEKWYEAVDNNLGAGDVVDSTFQGQTESLEKEDYNADKANQSATAQAIQEPGPEAQAVAEVPVQDIQEPGPEAQAVAEVPAQAIQETEPEAQAVAEAPAQAIQETEPEAQAVAEAPVQTIQEPGPEAQAVAEAPAQIIQEPEPQVAESNIANDEVEQIMQDAVTAYNQAFPPTAETEELDGPTLVR